MFPRLLACATLVCFLLSAGGTLIHAQVRYPITPQMVPTDNLETLPDLVISEFTITGDPFTEQLAYQHWVPVRIVIRNEAQTNLPGTTAGEFHVSVVGWNSEMVPFTTGISGGPVNSRSEAYLILPGLAPGQEYEFNGVIGIQWRCAEISYNQHMHFVAVVDSLPNNSQAEGSPCSGYMHFYDLENLNRGMVPESNEINNVSGETEAVLEHWYPN